MTDPESTGPAEGGADLRARLEECARLLQETRHLDADAQAALAGLVREMARDLHPGDDPAHADQLVARSADLIRALQHAHEAGPIATARTRLEEAAARAEAGAPVAAGFVRRLIDALANIGV